jgi:AraC family transcriptional regulator
MVLARKRTDFWGDGPPWREAAQFSFHRLVADAPEADVEHHIHEDAHFVLVLAGGYMSSAQSAPTVSAAPLLIFNPPGTQHRDRFLGGRGRFLAVSGGMVGQEDHAKCLRDPYLLWTARTIANDFEMMGAPALEACALQLRAAVERPDGDESIIAQEPPKWLGRAVEIIFTSADTQLSIAEVAHACGVHPVHLARVFRRYLGCAPGELLRGHRLERAAAMIGRSVASLADAAHAAGFVDQAHMSRVFRSNLNITPARWRKHQHVARVQDRGPVSG